MIGGVGIRKILRGWVGKDSNIDRQSTEVHIASELSAEESVKSSSKYSRRLKDELDQLET